jgi:hypothetical protein
LLPRSLLKIAEGNFKLEVWGLFLAVSWLIGKILPYTQRQFKGTHCLIIFLAEKGLCLKSKNLAQITLVPTGGGGTMGLDMKTRKNICARIYKRYQKASKKDKAKILDDYAPMLGHNRDYLAHLLANWGKTQYAPCGGKPGQIYR